MPLSSAITLTIATKRALATVSRPWASTIPRATALYWRTTFAVQNFAVAVWSAVRTVLVELPYALTSLNASTHAWLDSDGGGGGRNCLALFRMKVCTFAIHGVCAGANGGVSRYTPGAGASIVNVDVVAIGVIRPSSVRSLIT